MSKCVLERERQRESERDRANEIERERERQREREMVKERAMKMIRRAYKLVRVIRDARGASWGAAH